MGIPVVSSEIHGMAQRGGVVESTVIIGGAKSPIVSNGEADVVVSFEPLESLRILPRCNKNTLVITNTQPLPPFTVAVGQGKYPPVDEILDKIRKKVDKVIAIRGNDLAEKAGNVLSLNMVMLGALVGSGVTPVTEEAMKKTIGTSTKKAFLEANLKAFDLGKEGARKLAKS
jgi:indolepyruvate ferredoxin oxidoreductase beta subunit